MKRRKFLIAGGLAIAGNLCNGMVRVMQTAHFSDLAFTPQAPRMLTPTGTPEIAHTLAPSQTPPPALPTLTPTTAEANQDLLTTGFLVDDDFSDPTGGQMRSVTADSTGQIAITNGSLKVHGKAPGDNNPGIFASRDIKPADGQVIGVRFKVGFGQESGRIGLVSANGQPIASIRRTAAEGGGGVIEYGGQLFPVLNMYSGSWYDMMIFLHSQGTAFAINDGAGLELVLITPPGLAAPARLGYASMVDQHQDATIDAWYAPGPRYFPKGLLSQETPSVDYEADIAVNAAWVETRISRQDGAAGLRIRSIDRENEYRVYLDDTQLKVDQVLHGSATPVASSPIDYVDGGVLAARYNELTLTVYYNGMLVGTPNLKIGAAKLLEGTKIGLYSTGASSTFRAFSARAVRIDPPDDLSQRLYLPRRVLCLGDSLTNADKAFGYQNRLRKRLGDGWVTVDAGVSGQTTSAMLARLPGHLKRFQPEVLIVLGGINDIDKHASEAAVLANLQSIYATAQQAGCRVTAVTLPPFGGSKGWTEEKQAVLEAVNGWILENPLGASVVDAYQALEDTGTGRLLAKYDGGDHMHLSQAGYNTVADLILQNTSW